MKNNRPPEPKYQYRDVRSLPELRVGVRNQDVCIALGNWVISNLAPLFTEYQIKLVPIKCAADRFSLSPLSSFSDRSVFYDAVEHALQNGDIDFSVHPLSEIHSPDDELVGTAAFTARLDPRDMLVLPSHQTIADLLPGSRIGCYSERQRYQMDAFLPDMQYRFTESNVLPRLEKLRMGEYDALVLSASDILLLNPADYDFVFQPIALELMIPAAGSGIAAVRVAHTKQKLAKRLESALDDPVSRASFAVEILVETALGQPFNQVMGAHCESKEQRLYLHAFNAMGGRKKPLLTRAAVSYENSLVPDSGLLEISIQQLMGEAFLVGAGSGRVDFLTVRATEVLAQAEAVVYRDRQLMEIVNLAGDDCRQIYLGPGEDDFLKRPDQTPLQAMLAELRAGRTVVRLYSGDPLFQQPGFDEAMQLEKYGVRYEIVPGITEMTTAPAFMGAALHWPHCDGGLHIFSGKAKGLKKYYYASLAAAGETLVFRQAVTYLPDIVAALLRSGVPTDMPAAVVDEASLASQRVIYGTVSNIANRVVKENFPPEASLFVGQQFSPNRHLSWWPPKGALSGKMVTLFFTRPKNMKRHPLVEGIETLGGMVRSLNLLKTYNEGYLAKSTDSVLGGMIESLDDKGSGRLWIVLTTVNGVQTLANSFRRLRLDLRKLDALRFAVSSAEVGKALSKIGFTADYIPARRNIEELGKGLLDLLGRKDRVVLLRGSRKATALAMLLQTHEVNFTDLLAYETVPELPQRPYLSDLLQTTDYAVFTSPGAVVFFLEALQKAGLSVTDVQASNLRFFAKGNTTARMIQRHHLPLANSEQPREYLDLLSAMADYARKEGKGEH